MPPAELARYHRPEANTPILVVPVPSQSPITGVWPAWPKPISFAIPPVSLARNHSPLSKTPISEGVVVIAFTVGEVSSGTNDWFCAALFTGCNEGTAVRLD